MSEIKKQNRKTRSPEIAPDKLRYAGVYPPSHEKLILKAPQLLTPGARLRRERYIRFMTLEDMADLLDVSTSYLGAIERGQRPFSQNFLRKCHDKLDLSWNFLMDGEVFPGTDRPSMVNDSASAGIRDKINTLLSNCTPHDYSVCYHLFYTYLCTSRMKDDSDRA